MDISIAVCLENPLRAPHLFGPWFPLFILGSIALEIGWYLLVRMRSYPRRETATSLGIYSTRWHRGPAPACVDAVDFAIAASEADGAGHSHRRRKPYQGLCTSFPEKCR